MDPRRRARINKIFVNLKSEENGYNIYNCEVDQSDGSLMFENKQYVVSENEVFSQEIPTPPIRANLENIEFLPPTSPSSSSCQNSLSPHATKITFEADIHASFDNTYPELAVDRTTKATKTTEIKSRVQLKTISFIKPKHVLLHSNKSMTISKDCLDSIKVSRPTPTEYPSENDLNDEITSVFTDATQISLPQKKNDKHSLSLLTVKSVSASPKKMVNSDTSNITQDGFDNSRSSPSILPTFPVDIDDSNFDGGNKICLTPLSTNKRTIDNVDEIINLDDTNDKAKRKRSRKNEKKNWKRSTDKKLRESGMQYEGKKKEEGVWVYNKIRKEKTLKPRCNCKLSSQETKFRCSSITEGDRNTIFQKIWSGMSWKEKKMYIQTLTIVKPTERKRTEKENSRRKQTLELYLEVNSIKIRVCKTMFLNTLAIGEWMLHNWTRQNIENKTKQSETEKKTWTRQQHEELKKEDKVHKFFNSLPKLESHYCRSSSSKMYLEPIWEKKTQLLDEYNNVYAKENGYDAISITTLSKVFQDMNLSLFRPKKDLCDICEAHKCKNVSEETYLNHIKMKEAARAEKEADKKSDKEVLTMDLQSVLLCPKSNASAFYYKTKLIVHNFTVYDIKRSDGYCYIWNETEGSLTANDFSSIIIRMLELFKQKHNLTENAEIIIFSDGCTYQNRNVTLSNALLNFAVQNRIKILQKFLEKGHTQMEADSMHSVIERQVRNKKINVPADYVNIAKTACIKNPYHVEYLDHTFFKNFDKLRTYKTIRPGKKVGDPVVTNLRQLTYLPEGKIVYRLGFTEEHNENALPARAMSIDPISMQDLPRLYSERLKIKKSKFEHLQQLKMVIEADYHAFYDAIPYE